jgi:primosomal protein N''
MVSFQSAPTNTDYLQRINKLDRLPEWQNLAEKVLAQYANK